MTVKEKTEYEVCDKCSHKKMISERTYLCDGCDSEVDSREYEIKVFWADGCANTTYYHACGWHCVFDTLDKINQETKKSQKEIKFISLPHLRDINLFFEAAVQRKKDV